MSILPPLSKITRRRLGFATLAILLMSTFGALGFHYLENLNLLDSVYNATQTVTTVGYGDLSPKTRAGKVFAVFLCYSESARCFILVIFNNIS